MEKENGITKEEFDDFLNGLRERHLSDLTKRKELVKERSNGSEKLEFGLNRGIGEQNNEQECEEEFENLPFGV